MISRLATVGIFLLPMVALAQPPETATAEKAPAGPHLFLGCGRGSWWLNGNAGAVLHEHSGIVEHWALIKDGASPNYYYYHEHSLTGNTDWPTFRWRFYRHFDPCCPCIEVYRKYPSDHDWTYVCCASVTFEPPYAEATKEMRASAKEGE